MTEPTPTKSIDLRLDDSKTAAEIAALTDGDNKLMIASDTGDIWHIDPSGNKQNLSDTAGGMTWSVVGTDTNAVVGNGYLTQGTNKTVTFPASPNAGDTIGVKAWNQQDGSRVAIDGQGVYFNGQDEIQYLDDNVSRVYSYTASGGVVGWVEVSDFDRRIAGVEVSPAVTPDTEEVCGPQKVTDYNMSRPGTSDWSATNATLAKATHPTYGQFLEVTNVSGNGYAYEDTVFESGKFFNIELEMWGDGVSYPFIADSGATVQSGTVSTTLQSYSITNYKGIGSQLRCVVVGGTVGGIAGFRLVSAKECRTVQNTDKIHSLVKPYNGTENSEALVTGWPGTATVDGNEDEIIGSAATTDHYRSQAFTFVDGLCSFGALLAPGAQGWNKLEIDDGTTQFYAFVNSTTGEIGNTSGIAERSARVENDGRVRAKISATCAAGTGSFKVYAATSGTVSSYLGDGSTVDSYVTELQQWPGSIADNPAYVQTWTAAKTDEPAVMLLQDDIAKKQAAGFLQQEGATGWGLPQFEDGIEWVAPDAMQHFGGGSTVYGQCVNKTSWTTGSAQDILTISGATELMPVAVELTAKVGAQWFKLQASTYTADLLYLNTKAGAVNTILQLNAGSNYGTEFKGWLYYTKS